MITNVETPNCIKHISHEMIRLRLDTKWLQ